MKTQDSHCFPIVCTTLIFLWHLWLPKIMWYNWREYPILVLHFISERACNWFCSLEKICDETTRTKGDQQSTWWWWQLPVYFQASGWPWPIPMDASIRCGPGGDFFFTKLSCLTIQLFLFRWKIQEVLKNYVNYSSFVNSHLIHTLTEMLFMLA